MRSGRLATNTEFFRKLKILGGFKTNHSFARAIGKRPANVSRYLSGAMVPGDKVLLTSVEAMFDWSVKPLSEVRRIPKKLGELPNVPGIYVLYSSDGDVLYLGQAANLQAEIRQTLRRQIPVGVRFGPSLKKVRPKIADLAVRMSLYEINSPKVRHNIEALLLRVFVNQTHNVNIGKFR